MYKTIYIISIIFLFVTCTNKVNNKLISKLDDIQEQGDTFPRKAMLRLDSIKPLFKEESEYMRNKFALLNIRLHDKAYITHTSDSTIKEVCKFFEKHGTAKELQETYYYMGSVYRDLNDYPRAVTSFLKAIEVAENNNNIDSAIWENSCLQLSALYRKQFNYKGALETALKGLKVAELNGTVNERTYIDIGNCYFNVNDSINSLKYNRLAFECLKSNKLYKDNLDVICNLMGLFAKSGNKEMADSCFNILYKNSENPKPNNYLVNLAIYQEFCISIDSAAITRQEMFNSVNSTVSVYNASRWLTKYYITKEQYKLACKYAISFIEANERIIKERDFEHTTDANNIYKYQRDKEEEHRIMLENEKRRRGVIITISLAIISVLLMITFYFIRRKQVLAKLIDMNNRIDNLKSDIANKEKVLKEKEYETESKSQELYKMNEIITTLDQQRSALEQIIKEQMQQNNDLMKMLLSREMENEDDSGIVVFFKEAATGLRKVGKNEWRRLYAAVNKKYPGFKEELQQKLTRINDVTLQVCYLLKIGFTNKEIENVTGWPHQTVWYRIKQIEKVMREQFGAKRERS